MGSSTTSRPAPQGSLEAGFAVAERQIYGFLETLTARRRWLWLGVALAVAATLLLAFPTYRQIEGLDTWQAVLLQASEPFQHHPYQEGTHESKQAFRLLVPLVGGRLGLDIWGYLVLQALAGVALIAAAGVLAWRVTGDRVTSLLVLLATAPTWAGACGFVEVRGIFDAVALMLLLFAAAARRPAWIALFVALAGFADERAVVAAALVALFQFVRPDTPSRWPGVAGAAGGVFLYMGVRALLQSVTDLDTNLAGLSLFGWWRLGPAGAWSALEGLWLVIIAGFAALLLSRQKLVAAALLAGIGAVMTVAMSVADITRSSAYVLPAAFVGLAALQTASPAGVRRVCLFAAGASLVWPLYYVEGNNATINMVLPLPVRLVAPDL